MHLLPPFLRKYGIIPESYKIAMTYEEQLLWLCKHLEDIEAEFEEFKGTEGSLVELVRSFDGRITKNTEDIATISSKLVIQTLDSDLDVTNNLQLIIDGVYYTGNFIVKTFNEDFQTYQSLVPKETLFAYYQDYNIIIPLYDFEQNKSLKKFYEYDVDSNTWNLTNYQVSNTIDSQSYDYDIPTGKAVYDFVQSQLGGIEVKRLEGNVVLNAGFTITGLTTGFYETGEYRIYLHSQTAGNELFSNELVYYDMDNNIFIGSLKTVYYEGLAMDWVIAENGAVENTLSNSRNKIPTSQAVKTYVDSHSSASVVKTLNDDLLVNTGIYEPQKGVYYTGSYTIKYYNTDPLIPAEYITIVPENTLCVLDYTQQTIEILNYPQLPNDIRRYYSYYGGSWHLTNYTINENITKFTANVTLTSGTVPVTLTQGLYYTGNYKLINTNSSDIFPEDTLFFYNSTNNEFLKLTNTTFSSQIGSEYWRYLDYANLWYKLDYDTTGTINSSSTSTQIPTAEAVYRATLENYSTTEKVVGAWINNKPIYRKCFPVTITSFGAGIYGAQITTGITAEAIINYGGYITNGQNTFFPNQSRYDTVESNIAFYAQNQGATLTWETKVDRTAYSGYCWIDYTKP